MPVVPGLVCENIIEFSTPLLSTSDRARVFLSMMIIHPVGRVVWSWWSTIAGFSRERRKLLLSVRAWQSWWPGWWETGVLGKTLLETQRGKLISATLKRGVKWTPLSTPFKQHLISAQHLRQLLSLTCYDCPSRLLGTRRGRSAGYRHVGDVFTHWQKAKRKNHTDPCGRFHNLEWWISGN